MDTLNLEEVKAMQIADRIDLLNEYENTLIVLTTIKTDDKEYIIAQRNCAVARANLKNVIVLGGVNV